MSTALKLPPGIPQHAPPSKPVSRPQLQIVPPPAPTMQPQFVPAGFWIRLLACLIDYAVFFMAAFAIMMPVALLVKDKNVVNLFQLPLRLLILGVSFWMIKRYGGTPGKLALQMRIVRRETGEHLSYGKIFVRESIGKFVSALFFAVGYLRVGFSSDKRAWHDMIAGTQVIRKI